MAFFNHDVPLISRKPPLASAARSSGVWRVHYSLGQAVLWSSFYTRHDQACLNWGILVAYIFAIAQFLPISWATQALMASLLTVVGSVVMTWLMWRYTYMEQLAWILYSWLGLMLLGTIITDLSVWNAWGAVLIRLCPLWLALCGVGYFITALGMRSRLILLCSALHFGTIGLLPFWMTHQLLLTGAVISGSVMLLAQLQWDSNGVCDYQSLN